MWRGRYVDANLFSFSLCFSVFLLSIQADSGCMLTDSGVVHGRVDKRRQAFLAFEFQGGNPRHRARNSKEDGATFLDSRHCPGLGKGDEKTKSHPWAPEAEATCVLLLRSATRRGGTAPLHELFGVSGDTTSLVSGEVNNLYNGINNIHLTKQSNFWNYKT